MLRRVIWAAGLLTPSGIPRLLDGLQRWATSRRRPATATARVVYAKLTDAGCEAQERDDRARGEHPADVRRALQRGRARTRDFSTACIRSLGLDFGSCRSTSASGEVPRKRHVQFRDNGTLLTRRSWGLEGFSGTSRSSTTSRRLPRRKLGDFEQIEREEVVPEQHKPLHLKTWDVKPGGDNVTAAAPDWNDDVEIFALPPDGDDGRSPQRRGGDEVIFVHEGSGTIDSIFG